jgi:prepilin-type N-terminal cleavage/methylation domain-containing protein
MRGSRGFSLLELLIVIMVLGVLSAVAIPNVLAARRAANEASAIASLKAFIEANHTYFGANHTFGTPGQLHSEGFLDEQLGTIQEKCGKMLFLKHGYALTMVPTKLERELNRTGERIIITEYYMEAIPQSAYEPGLARTGVRWFYIDSITNVPWIIKRSLEGQMDGGPCSNSYTCFDIKNNKPGYDACLPLN